MPWITIFPDHPFEFAWFREPIDESKLNNYVGDDIGDCSVQDQTAKIGNDEVPRELAKRILNWLSAWLETDKRLEACPPGEACDHEYQTLLEEGNAVDAEGIEITKALKNVFGGKYRFRYSYAWSSKWVVV